MMKEKRKGLLQRGIMVAVSALTIVAGAGTALAYQPMVSSDSSFSDIVLDDTPDFFSYEFTNINIDAIDFSQSDEAFIYLDGTQEMNMGDSSSRALCM